MRNFKIFKIQNEYKNGKKYKVITILGIKFKFAIRNLKPLNASSPLKRHKRNKKVYISITAAVKNEAPYIVEWIEYHKLIGVERFYIYDNESEDNLKEVLMPYINDGTVIYRFVEGKCMQVPIYNDALYNYGKETRWMALIDIDEFIVPVQKYYLKDVLVNYEKYPAIGVNWLVFDSNHIENYDERLVIEKFKTVHENHNNLDDKIIKSIINPKKVLTFPHCHFGVYKNKEYAIDENYNPIDANNKEMLPAWCSPFSVTQQQSIKQIQINHYFCKSREEFIKKINRGRADIEQKYDFEENKLNFPDETENLTILKYLSKLKENMSRLK